VALLVFIWEGRNLKAGRGEQQGQVEGRGVGLLEDGRASFLLYYYREFETKSIIGLPEQ
jgi:hypothetical protein